MLEPREVLLFFHILFAMLWVGGIMFVGWGVFPALRKFPFKEQRLILLTIMRHVHLLLTAVGLLVITTGYLLGTVLGPLASFNQMLTTPYGHKFLAAFIIGIITLLWGIFIGFRETLLVLNDEFIWFEAEKGRKNLLYRSLLKIAVLESAEVLGFFALLYIMVSF